MLRIKMTSPPDIKEELILILTPIFGENVKKTISEYYDSSNPGEIIALARHMLSGYMGEANADKIIQKLLVKFPKLKTEVR